MGIVVTPVNALVSRMRKAAPADPTTKKCPECLSEIPIDARAIAFQPLTFLASWALKEDLLFPCEIPSTAPLHSRKPQP